jgi:hypothetical protein
MAAAAIDAADSNVLEIDQSNSAVAVPIVRRGFRATG